MLYPSSTSIQIKQFPTPKIHKTKHIIQSNIKPSKQQKENKIKMEILREKEKVSAWMDLIVGNGNRFEAFEMVIFENEVAFARVL